MGTPAKERMNKMRRKREGRALSVWLDPDSARIFKKIKLITKDTNDAIIKMAIQDVYNSVFIKRIYEFSKSIVHKQGEREHNNWRDDVELTVLYRDLIKLLQLDYDTVESIKKALNVLAVPNYNGTTGTWKVGQVRKFM